MAGDPITGVSVITLADVMDAGEVLATVETAVDPFETAGELHDRLAELGRQPVLDTLSAVQAGSLHPSPQDQSAITLAPKLSREEGTVDFSLAAELVRGRVHGLTPWPGCDIRIGDQDLRLRRVKSCPDAANDSEPGTLLESNLVACGSGQLEILEVQPAGGRPMSWKQWQLGHRIQPGTRICAT